MKLATTPDGFEIAAADLGSLLDLAEAEVRAAMRGGRITSRIERGEGEDAGRFRVTFFSEQRRVRLIVDDEGTVLQQSRVIRRPPPERSAGR